MVAGNRVERLKLHISKKRSYECFGDGRMPWRWLCESWGIQTQKGKITTVWVRNLEFQKAGFIFGTISDFDKQE